MLTMDGKTYVAAQHRTSATIAYAHSVKRLACIPSSTSHARIVRMSAVVLPVLTWGAEAMTHTQATKADFDIGQRKLMRSMARISPLDNETPADYIHRAHEFIVGVFARHDILSWSEATARQKFLFCRACNETPMLAAKCHQLA